MGVETILCAPRHAATPAMTDDSQLSFTLPTVSRKKVTAAFDGGRLSSDAGVMLLALAERRRKVAETPGAHCRPARSLAHQAYGHRCAARPHAGDWLRLSRWQRL